jgi:hypothetical protein
MGGAVVNILSRVAFGVALTLSSVLTLILLVAFATFRFGPLMDRPLAILIIAVMVSSPFVFGLVGTRKETPGWRFVAAGAMLTLVLLYCLGAWGYLGPIRV